MTDNEIKKALECCTSDGCSCTQCPYEDTKHIINDEFEIMPNGKSYDTWSCDEWLKADLLDLINRLQKYKEYYKQCRNECWDKIMFISKQCDELQAENERLQKYHDDMEDAIYSFREDHAKVKFFKNEIKAEAVKEFAERLKKEMKICLYGSYISLPLKRMVIEDIDNILKEMVGEQRKEDEGK